MLFKLKQRAEQRKSVSKQQDSLQTRSPASIQKSIETHQWSRKYSNTPFTTISDFSDKDDVVAWPTSDLGSQVKHASNTESAIGAPLSTAGPPSDHARVPSLFCPEWSLAPSVAADETNKPSASSRPSVTHLDPERFRNKRVPQETDALAIELNNAYFTVQAGSTISHAILLYYQGRGAEMLKELTRTTILAERRGDVETMVRAQLWKAIILDDMGKVENMPQLLGDVVDALLQSGCGDDGDFYQLSKLWLQYSDAIIGYLTDEYVRQSGHSLTEAEAAAQRDEYQHQLGKITVLLATKFDHSEWPNPALTYNAGHSKYDSHTTGLSSELHTELQRLQVINRMLEKENCDLKMNNIRYQEERKAIPHLSTAFSQDGRFPSLGHTADSQQHGNDIVESVVAPGPISALMKELGQEPCHQLPASFENTSSGPASQWLAQKHAEWRESSSFDQSPRRPRWGSSSLTRGEYSRKYSKASFSPTSPWRRYQSSRRTPSWGSNRYPRPLQVRNAGPASSPRNSFSRPKVPQRQASGLNNFRGRLPVSSSALKHKAANSWRGDQLGDTFKRATTDMLSTLRTVPGSTVQRHRQPSENPSPYTRRCLPTQPASATESSLEGIHYATDQPSGPTKPLAASLHHSRKQSLTSPTNTLTPELLPLTDTLSPSQLEAELPQLHENQERRRRSMSLSSSSLTSPSLTSYDHERSLALFEYQQRHGASGHPVQSTKQHDESRDKKVDDSSRSSMSESIKPTDIVRTDRESASMSMSSAPNSSVRTSSSKPPSLRSYTSAKSKPKRVIDGIGTAPGTPASKSPPSSAICMPSMATSTSGSDDRSSSDIHSWTGFSAHAPEFTPRRPTKPNALRPQRSSDKFTPPLSQASDYSEQDRFPYNDQSPLSHKADEGFKTSNKDIRISLFLSQLETDQAATLDRARRMSKPVVSSPLRRSSQVGEDDEEEEQGSLTTAPVSSNAARDEEDAAVVQKDISNASATARHDDDKRQSEDNTQIDDANEIDDGKQRPSVQEAIDPAIQAKPRPSSLEKEPTTSESNNYFRGSSWRRTSEQAVQLVQEDEQLGQMAKAQSVSEGLEAAPKLADWQRFVAGEDWRNGTSRFPRQMKQQGTYRISSFAARGAGNRRRLSKASIRPRMDSRELPDVYEQRWEKLSDEMQDEVAPRTKDSKRWTLDDSVGDGFSDEKHTQDETSDLYTGSPDGRQYIDAFNRGAPGATKKVDGPKQARDQDISDKYADKEQEYDGSVSSMSDSEETRSPAGPTAAERNEAQPRGSPQSRTQPKSSRPGQESYRVQSTDDPRVPARSKRYNNTFGHSNYEDIDYSYPSPTSPQQHIQGYGQLRDYIPARPMAHHSRSTRRDRSPMEQEHNGVARDALAGPTPSVDGSDYSGYSFNGFSGAYSHGTRSTQSRADARLSLRPREPVTDTEATMHQHEHIEARQASFPHDRLYHPRTGRTVVPSGTSPAAAAAVHGYKLYPPVGASDEAQVNRTFGVPIGYQHQYQYLPSTTYTYQPQAPMHVQPSTRQHEVSDLHQLNTKVPRESVWEDQRRAFDQEKEEEERAVTQGSMYEQQVGEQSEDEDGERDGHYALSPMANISRNF